MKFDKIAEIVNGNILSLDFNDEIQTLIIDSRKPFITAGAVFFAISGERHDAHQFIQALYEKGVRHFVVEKDINIEGRADILLVENVVKALQIVSEYHRSQFDIPVIGITGSNGKTITKEWLYNCLAPFYRIARSPHSYNSQIGVPLSVWSLNGYNNLAIFEAGISQPDEMKRLARIIKPTIGIFTNIGAAHDEGFVSIEQKLDEKSKLFEEAETVIFNGDNDQIFEHFEHNAFSWGRHERCQIKIIGEYNTDLSVTLSIAYEGQHFNLKFPFTDSASVENAMHVVAIMLYLAFDFDVIQERIAKLIHLNMRLELKKAANDSYLIDDTYNNDLGGLKMALEFLTLQKQKEKRVMILSDLLQSGLEEVELYSHVSTLISTAGIHHFIGVGEAINRNKNFFKGSFYKTTEEFLAAQHQHDLSNAVILVKGARVFGFEKIVKSLEDKIHGTVLEISLDALTDNLNFYRSRLGNNTKLMVMVKAFAYGSGSNEIANLMQYHRVDYLGVAYSDEGVRLRENGIYLPIMVMNPSPESFESLIKHNLEPEIYSISLLLDFIRVLNGREATIHLKLETGMKRLGFDEKHLEELNSILLSNKNLKVVSIFSHLAGADEDIHEAFSHQQAKKFEDMSQKVMTKMTNKPMRHLLNSPGILRYPEYQFDMVRLGIGLYGLETNNTQYQNQLMFISTLKTVVSQISSVTKGDSIGYGRKGVAEKDLMVATIAIGYADGFSRAFSQGKGEVWINGKRARVIGNVCMDMTMIDITDIDVKEGDEVEIFGGHISIKELASTIDTIPYEILTSISQRVKRIYFTQ
jgi:alanine racemase